MKTKSLLLIWLFLFAILLPARAETFNGWRSRFFTPAQFTDPAISGADADPDGDHLGNFTEFVLGNDPWITDGEPIVTPAFTLNPSTSLLHLSAAFKIPLDKQGTLLMPQVTEALGTRWRADQIDLWSGGFAPDGRYEFKAVDTVPANLPERRFIRLLIAADADEDGMPDDWETAIGLNPADPFDAMDDADGDGDSNFTEFLHGTNPLNAADNIRRDDLPRAPRNAVVVYSADGTRVLVWEDVSDNEQFFAIHAVVNGAAVEIGRAGPNQTSFGLPESSASISVSSGNETGMSSAAAASDAGRGTSDGEDDGVLDSGHKYKGLLPTPQITELRRLDVNRVKITWTCTMPGVSPGELSGVELVILRQAFDGNWERARVQPWATGDSWVDGAAAITKIWRYAAITTYTSGTDPNEDAGSDAYPPQELDYGPSTYGILAYRNGVPAHVWSPPGHDLTPAAQYDWFRTIARSFNEGSPSFIPTNPALLTGQEAPPLFRKKAIVISRAPSPPNRTRNYPAVAMSSAASRSRLKHRRKSREPIQAVSWNSFPCPSHRSLKARV